MLRYDWEMNSTNSHGFFFYSGLLRVLFLRFTVTGQMGSVIGSGSEKYLSQKPTGFCAPWNTVWEMLFFKKLKQILIYKVKTLLG